MKESHSLQTYHKSYAVIALMFLALQSQANQTTSDWSTLFQEQYVGKLVECKTTLDELKWSNNLWPKENKVAKSKFADVFDIEQTRQSVHKSLRMQEVLFDTFNFEITPAMLQHDMDRMARNTKDAKRLKQMFAVLGNDPNSIAQCISRPYLVQKKLANQYNYNSTIHHQVRLTAQTDLVDYLQSKNTDVTTAQVYSITYALQTEDSNDFEKGFEQEISEEIIVDLDEEEFKQKLKQLENQNLQEQETAFIYTEILEQTQQSIKVQTLYWPKQSQHTWLQNQADTEYSQIQKPHKFSLPTITGSDMPLNNKAATDTWVSKYYAPGFRAFYTAIWSGSEMIVWGGDISVGETGTNSGGRYNPSSDSWLATSVGVNVPSARRYHTAIWSGSEMVIWGGEVSLGFTNTGGRYNPISDSWLATSVGVNVPTGRSTHKAVWSGSEMIVWGGDGNTGGRYDPSGDSWLATSVGANVPTSRGNFTVIWSGNEMIIWGGHVGGGIRTNTGSRYDPVSDSWLTTSIGVNVPTDRASHTAIWSGSEMIVWGGDVGGGIRTNTGSRYDPVSDSWLAMSIGANVPTGRENHSAIWSGNKMIVWGGFDGIIANTGGRYDPISDSWLATSVGGNVPTGGHGHTAVWSGSELIIWGSRLGDGGRYDPLTNSWVSISIGGNVPTGRYRHTAVWDGNEMIVWGGEVVGGPGTNTGGRYNPSTDSWFATSVGANVPTERVFHTAVWSGSEMIIWGGSGSNTGGRYNPISDSWLATSVGANVPLGRLLHTVVWSGSEMIIWGGYNGNKMESGGRYNPTNDSWLATSVGANVPSGRFYHTAIWSGSEMIVWGGSHLKNTGGRYDPSNDSWLATNIGANVPTGRELHTAVWNGNEMIVWGGEVVAGNKTNSGGRYDPSSDSWIATSIDGNVPIGRELHTAVWSGSEMIVWGGNDEEYFNTGGRYDPSSDSWLVTTGNNAPSKRSWHTAVWSGNEMIVWAGITGVYINSMGIYYPDNSYDLIFAHGFE